MLKDATRQMRAEGNTHVAFGNLARTTDTTFELALLRWRRGESPVGDMGAVVEWAERMIAAVGDWQPEEHTVVGYIYALDIARYASFLLGRDLTIPTVISDLVGRHRSENADVALSYHILDAIDGRPWREDLEPLLSRLAAKKRQALAVETYQTYIAILNTPQGDKSVEDLVRRAEENYTRRARDPFFSGGPGYMGGGPDNAYMVDFVLAAILKKIGWDGETIHRWRWSPRSI